MAVRQVQPEFAFALLKIEANKDVCYENSSPLPYAVMDGHLETAEAIYSFCSDEQKNAFSGTIESLALR
jgi:hypothetical protein